MSGYDIDDDVFTIRGKSHKVSLRFIRKALLNKGIGYFDIIDPTCHIKSLALQASLDNIHLMLGRDMSADVTYRAIQELVWEIEELEENIEELKQKLGEENV